MTYDTSYGMEYSHISKRPFQGIKYGSHLMRMSNLISVATWSASPYTHLPH